MVSDRTRGIYNLCLICYLAISSAAFWGWVFLYNIRIPLSAAGVKEYLYYNEILMLGLVWGFRSRKSNYDIIDRRWSFANANAIRQVAAALFAVFVFMTAFHETSISRLF